MSRYSAQDLESALPRFATFRPLGHGGEGKVYGVYDRNRKEDVALKLMPDSGDPSLPERFVREYRILALSRSPRLVRVYDYDTVSIRDEEGVARVHYWYSMEKCEGSVRKTYKRLLLSERMSLTMQMLEGLAFLHTKGIAHRDVKPDNLFLVSGNQLKIGDFGIATLRGGSTGRSDAAGSPPYLAPERWTAAGSADFRPSDQYAAGVTAFELLSAGGSPLDFGVDYMRAHLRGALHTLRIPERRGQPAPSVDRVIGRMLAKRPEDRYPDIAVCKGELEAALVQDGVRG